MSVTQQTRLELYKAFCSDGNVLKSALSIMAADSHMWLLNMSDMGSVTEELDKIFILSLII